MKFRTTQVQNVIYNFVVMQSKLPLTSSFVSPEMFVHTKHLFSASGVDSNAQCPGSLVFAAVSNLSFRSKTWSRMQLFQMFEFYHYNISDNRLVSLFCLALSTLIHDLTN